MPLIDPYELRQLLDGTRSLAIVGNAPSILEWENGPLIDSHDVVIRFNGASTQGLEDRIGARTDVLVCNGRQRLDSTPEPRKSLNPRCIVCLVGPAGLQGHGGPAFREWVGDVPLLSSFTPQLYGVEIPLHMRAVSKGVVAIYSFLRLLPVERLFLTGFTMFGSVPGGYDEYYRSRRKPSTWHDADQEARIFARIVAGFSGELTVTPEVQELLALNGLDLEAREHARVRGRSIADRARQRLFRLASRHVLGLGMRLRRRAEGAHRRPR